MNRKTIIITAVIILLLIALSLFYFLQNPKEAQTPDNNSVKIEESKNDKFRNSIVKFINESINSYKESNSTSSSEDLKIEGDWTVSITFYKEGDIKGMGSGRANVLSNALNIALLNSINNSSLNNNFDNTRFLVNLTLDSKPLDTFIASGDKGEEIYGGVLPKRVLTKNDIKEMTIKAKEFLLKMEDPKTHGFHKEYDAPTDSFEPRVHTVYSSSIVYTLLKIYDHEKDERIKEKLDDWGSFILSMQKREGKEKGAFSYSYYLNEDKKEERYVVGTTALTIFTLIDLYERTGEEKYMEAAREGADWMLTMQGADGKMQSSKRYDENSDVWYSSNQFSVLYNGQSLSALSRLYKETGEDKYYNGASKIAEVFMNKVKKEGCYVGDEYRDPNPISSAWIIMSLLDFYKIDENPLHRAVIEECSSQLLERQRTDKSDFTDYGRWENAYSTSGNGWIAEVLSEVYGYCKENNWDGCEKYKEPIIRIFRWIIQNTYTASNSYLIPNPERAEGGIFWNQGDRYVRTDSDCHGGNPYVNMLPYLKEGVLIKIEEETFDFLK